MQSEIWPSSEMFLLAKDQLNWVDIAHLNCDNTRMVQKFCAEEIQFSFDSILEDKNMQNLFPFIIIAVLAYLIIFRKRGRGCQS